MQEGMRRYKLIRAGHKGRVVDIRSPQLPPVSVSLAVSFLLCLSVSSPSQINDAGVKNRQGLKSLFSLVFSTTSKLKSFSNQTGRAIAAMFIRFAPFSVLRRVDGKHLTCFQSETSFHQVPTAQFSGAGKDLMRFQS